VRIAMIGGGYVGLVSGACFAKFGSDVANVEAGRLVFTDDVSAALEDVEAVFIAVGTPTRRGDGHADLSWGPLAARGWRATFPGNGKQATCWRSAAGYGKVVRCQRLFAWIDSLRDWKTKL
jgi:UDP-glucose 6-dehydrogenase